VREPCGSTTLPQQDPGAWLWLGYGQYGHPGRGAFQGGGGVNRYSIAAYTVPQAGEYAIANALLSNQGSSIDGVEVFVHTSQSGTPQGHWTTAPGSGSSVSYNMNLGSLNAGSTIYVCFGPNGNDVNDTFYTQFSVVSVPESAALLSLISVIAIIYSTVGRFRL
jgi:hypothetical protein